MQYRRGTAYITGGRSKVFDCVLQGDLHINATTDVGLDMHLVSHIQDLQDQGDNMLTAYSWILLILVLIQSGIGFTHGSHLLH